MAQVSGIAQYIYNLKKFWSENKVTAPALWSEVGELFKLFEKRLSAGWDGDGNIYVPMRSGLNGNSGASYSKVAANSVSPTGVQMVVPARELWNQMQITAKLLAFGKPMGNANGKSSLSALIDDTIAGWSRSMSYLVLGDGTGRIGKGNAAYSVAGPVITFLNTVSASQFEVGDVIVLIDEGAAVPAGGMPTPRAGTLLVTAVGPARNQITVSANVNTVVGAVNTDFISKDAFFSGGTTGIPDGVFRYIPLTTTEASTDLFGVVRGANPRRLSGGRVLVNAGDGVFDIALKLGTEIKSNKGGQLGEDYITVVGANMLAELTAESKSQGLTFTASTSQVNSKKLIMGADMTSFAWPGLGVVNIICDSFLHDPSVSDENDRTMMIINQKDWSLNCADGITFRDDEGSGSILHKGANDSNDVHADYGAFLNLYCDKPMGQFVASTRAAD